MRNFIQGLCVVAALGAALGVADTAIAQGKKKSLLITVVQQPPRKGHVEVLLKAAPDSRNLVFVDSTASAEDLEAAVDIVRHMRDRLGDTVSRDVRGVPRSVTGPKPDRDSSRAKRLAAFGEDLKRLDKREKEHVDGVGKVKTFDIITTAFKNGTPR